MSEAASGKLPLHWKMLIGFLAGLALGLVAHYLSGADAGWVKWLTTYVTQPAGTLFLRLIFMLVIPLLFSALVIGVAEMGDVLIGTEGKGLPLVEKVTDQAIAALSAEAVGCMGELNKATVEYCKTRKQFGVPIGKFQVLQHRMVDMFMAYEQSVSMTYMVNLKLDENEGERVKAAAGAKVQIGKAGRFVGQQAVQLHGGMGMTDELNVGHYFKRLTMIDTQFGNVDHQLKRYSTAA